MGPPALAQKDEAAVFSPVPLGASARRSERGDQVTASARPNRWMPTREWHGGRGDRLDVPAAASEQSPNGRVHLAGTLDNAAPVVAVHVLDADGVLAVLRGEEVDDRVTAVEGGACTR